MSTVSDKSPSAIARSPSTGEPAPAAPDVDAHEQVQADVQSLLTEMTTSFKSFSETIFSKIDLMQEKLAALDKSVTDLAASPAAPPRSDQNLPAEAEQNSTVPVEQP